MHYALGRIVKTERFVRAAKHFTLQEAASNRSQSAHSYRCAQSHVFGASLRKVNRRPRRAKAAASRGFGIIAARAGVLLDGPGKRPQMALESGQGLNQCAEGPFGVFRIAAVGPESVDKGLLALNNATDFGNTAFGRREKIVGSFCLSHKQFSPDRRKVSLI
jgi:hypothetical protein